MAATTATADGRRMERDNVEHIFYLGRGYRSRPHYRWERRLWVGQRSISGRSALYCALSQKRQAEILGGIALRMKRNDDTQKKIWGLGRVRLGVVGVFVCGEGKRRAKNKRK